MGNWPAIFITPKSGAECPWFWRQTQSGRFCRHDRQITQLPIAWSNETVVSPAIKNWHQNLTGRQLFGAQPFSGIKPVTGAH